MSVVALASNIEPWQGIAAISVLAAVIAYLFKLMWTRSLETEKERRGEAKEQAAELARRDTKEAEIRASCETRLREMAVEHARQLRELHVESRAHEDATRHEFAEIMETVSAQAQESAKGVTQVLDKLYDRLTGPKSRH